MPSKHSSRLSNVVVKINKCRWLSMGSSGASSACWRCLTSRHGLACRDFEVGGRGVYHAIELRTRDVRMQRGSPQSPPVIWTKTNEVIHKSAAVDRHSDCTQLRRRSHRKGVR
jgi:hypothetical protein